jgi:prepilin-type N-terminal cleavage/methylation domain-containing protein
MSAMMRKRVIADVLRERKPHMHRNLRRWRLEVSMNKKGFTLLELLIVMAIIGILAAIAIPQFSNYRTRAHDAYAVTVLKNAVLTQEAYFTDHQIYTNNKNDLVSYGLEGEISKLTIELLAGGKRYRMRNSDLLGEEVFIVTGPGGSIKKE